MEIDAAKEFFSGFRYMREGSTQDKCIAASAALAVGGISLLYFSPVIGSSMAIGSAAAVLNAPRMRSRMTNGSFSQRVGYWLGVSGVGAAVGGVVVKVALATGSTMLRAVQVIFNNKIAFLAALYASFRLSAQPLSIVEGIGIGALSAQILSAPLMPSLAAGLLLRWFFSIATPHQRTPLRHAHQD